MLMQLNAWALIGLAGLGLMVFVHELGHFVAAKMNGVDVDVFSLGWGPRLAGFRYRGTLYQISWFPIGGYCKMKGEMVPGIAGGSAGAAEAPAPEKGSFLAAARWRRLVIYVFGPLFNLAFAFLVFLLIWGIGFRIPSTDNRIVLATDYTLDSFPQPPPATVAGLKTGDRITAIDGVAVENFQDILESISVEPGKALRVTIQRSESGSTRTKTLTITPLLDKDTGAGRIGIRSWGDPIVRSVAPGSAAAIAGLRPGDRIIEADSRPVNNTMDLFQALTSKPEKVPITYERAGSRDTANLVFVYDRRGPNLGIEFVFQMYHSPPLGIWGVLRNSVQQTWGTITLTVKGIGLLFKGINIRNAVAGPLGITVAIGNIASSGFEIGVDVGLVSLFRFLSLLSIVLFLMNLLPIPAMDGGQIVLLVIEILRGRPVRTSLVWRLQLIGFTLMISLFVLVTMNELFRMSGR